MAEEETAHEHQTRPHCCPCGSHDKEDRPGFSRRGFLGGALAGVALTGLTWSKLAAAEPDAVAAPKRRPLRVKPILTYRTYKPRKQTSWRCWGGIHSEEEAKKEVARINGELKKLEAEADFPVEFMPLVATTDSPKAVQHEDFQKADVILSTHATAILTQSPL